MMKRVGVFTLGLMAAATLATRGSENQNVFEQMDASRGGLVTRLALLYFGVHALTTVLDTCFHRGIRLAYHMRAAQAGWGIRKI